MKPHRTTFAALMLVTAALAQTVGAAAPPAFRGTVVRVSDADTYVVERSDGSQVKVRLRWADSPEVSHNKNEVNQPGGLEAKAWAQDYVLRTRVTVEPHSWSYGRIVGNVTPDDLPNVGLAAVAAGHAWLDLRYKPPAEWMQAMEKAKKEQRGLWSEPNPIPPQEWRKLTREQQRKRGNDGRRRSSGRGRLE